MSDDCTLLEQMEELRRVYKPEVFKSCPLLPPFERLEIEALEWHYRIQIPPILKFYLLNVSRELSFESGRSLVVPFDCDLDYCGYRACRFGSNLQSYLAFSDVWTCHERALDINRFHTELIWLEGPHVGFVTQGFPMYEDCLANLPRKRTLFDRLRTPALTPTMAFHKQPSWDMTSSIADEFAKFRSRTGYINQHFSKFEIPHEKQLVSLYQFLNFGEIPSKLADMCRPPEMQPMPIAILFAHRRIELIVENFRPFWDFLQRRAARLIQKKWREHAYKPGSNLVRTTIRHHFQQLQCSFSSHYE